MARPLHAGRAVIVVQTELTGDDGNLAAQVTQTQAVPGRGRPPHPGHAAADAQRYSASDWRPTAAARLSGGGIPRRVWPVMQAGQEVLDVGLEPDDRLPDLPFAAGGAGALVRAALVTPPGPGEARPGQPDGPRR